MEAPIMEHGNKLGTVDMILLVLSMVATTALGLYFVNQNKSVDSYMRGDKKVGVFPVAVSLMTSALSGLTLLGASSEFYYQGVSYSFVVLPIIICGPIAAFTIFPIFHNMNELSLYQYLKRRYGNTVKYFVTIVYMLHMLSYNAIVLYLPSMAIRSIMGVSKFYSIILIGLLSVIYSGLGGIKAVIWTDVLQAFLMYLSIILVGVLGTLDAGGFAEVIEDSLETDRFRLDSFFSLDLTERHTFYGILFGATLKYMYTICVNQVQMQRVLSLPKLRQGQWAFIFCSLFSALIVLFSTYMGMVIAGSYRLCDPYIHHEIPRRDAIVVHYVVNRLKQLPGLCGLFVAGIFSATLSTMSSFSNSMAAITLEDFIKPTIRWHRSRAKGGIAADQSDEISETTATWLVKVVSMIFGSLCVVFAFSVEQTNARLLQTTATLLGAIGVPFLASFALGLFTRYTNSIGVMVGLLFTITMGIYITIRQVFYHPPLRPTVSLFYNSQCAKVFNRTITVNELDPLGHDKLIFDEQTILSHLDHDVVMARAHFRIEDISYMMLPLVQFVVMIVLATTVSLFTGGWNQTVDEDYLIPFMRKKTRPIEGKSFEIKSS